MDEKPWYESAWTWVIGIPAAVAAWAFAEHKNWWGWFEEDPAAKEGDKVKKGDDAVDVDKGKDGKKAEEKTAGTGVAGPQVQGAALPPAEEKVDAVKAPQPASDTVIVDVGKKEGDFYQHIYINADGKFLAKLDDGVKPEAGTLVVDGLVKNLSAKDVVFEVHSFAKFSENGLIKESHHYFTDANKRPSFKITDNPTSMGIIGESLYGKIHSDSEDNKKVIEYLRNNWAGKVTEQDLSSLVDKSEFPNMTAGEAKTAEANKTPVVQPPVGTIANPFGYF